MIDRLRPIHGMLLLAAALAGCGSGEPDGDVANSPPARPVLPSEPAFTVEEGFDELTLDDFATFPEEAATDSPNWRAAGRRLEGEGDPRGYLHSHKSFENFTLRLDVRFPTADEVDDPDTLNTGVLLFLTGEHRVWPRCLEVQGRYDELAHVKSNARDVTVEVTDDPAARETARKPAGEWNSLEIVARDGAVTTFLNGTPIAAGQPTDLRRGPIGLQSEGNRVHFRNLRIRIDE